MKNLRIVCGAIAMVLWPYRLVLAPPTTMTAMALGVAAYGVGVGCLWNADAALAATASLFLSLGLGREWKDS